MQGGDQKHQAEGQSSRRACAWSCGTRPHPAAEHTVCSPSQGPRLVRGGTVRNREQRHVIASCHADSRALASPACRTASKHCIWRLAAGCPTFVPSCLTMMPPAPTDWPPYTFTPRRLDTESRPFFVDPAPFLCAASIGTTAGLKRAGAGRAAKGRRLLQRQLSCRPLKELTSACAMLSARVYTKALHPRSAAGQQSMMAVFAGKVLAVKPCVLIYTRSEDNSFESMVHRWHQQAARLHPRANPAWGSTSAEQSV